jgi:hypothetical protein
MNILIQLRACKIEYENKITVCAIREYSTNHINIIRRATQIQTTMRPPRKICIAVPLTEEIRLVPQWKKLIQPQFDTKESITVEDYGTIIEQYLGCEEYHIKQYFFLEAWIELGGPLIKELGGKKTCTNNWITNLVKFDGRRCKNIELAVRSYRFVFEELTGKNEHADVIQRVLRENAKFVALMLQVDSSKFGHLIDADVRSLADEYLKKRHSRTRSRQRSWKLRA